MFVRNRFSPRVDTSDLSCDWPTLTEQAHKDMCDINNVIQRCAAGIMPQVRPLQYFDCSEIGDFQAMQDKVLAVTNYFKALPAEIRAKFDNNVVAFADFATNPDNAQALHEMGLLELPEITTLPETGETPVASSDAASQSSNETTSTL